jgi:hypothetical protein
VDRKTVQSGDPNTSSQISSVISSGISAFFRLSRLPKLWQKRKTEKAKGPKIPNILQIEKLCRGEIEHVCLEAKHTNIKKNS